ncbi:hypothetical protein BJ742DRAFT_740192 [Cladochytrium replicatum]|nr:hypothetical protein BJ742DRAFT_740192 [Cladochytrium replicatum]
MKVVNPGWVVQACFVGLRRQDNNCHFSSADRIDERGRDHRTRDQLGSRIIQHTFYLDGVDPDVQTNFVHCSSERADVIGTARFTPGSIIVKSSWTKIKLNCKITSNKEKTTERRFNLDMNEWLDTATDQILEKSTVFTLVAEGAKDYLSDMLDALKIHIAANGYEKLCGGGRRTEASSGIITSSAISTVLPKIECPMFSGKIDTRWSCLSTTLDLLECAVVCT